MVGDSPYLYMLNGKKYYLVTVTRENMIMTRLALSGFAISYIDVVCSAF